MSPRNSSISDQERLLYGWADDLAAGRLTREQLQDKAQGDSVDRGQLAINVRALSKLARDAELDHRAGQLKSAEARAYVVIAVADRLQSSLPDESKGGFMGRLLGTGDRVTDLLLAAASQSHATLGGLARDVGDLATSEREYASALEIARRMRGGELAVGAALLGLGHTYRLQGRMKEAEESLVQAHPLLVHAQGTAYVPLDLYFLGIVQAATGRADEAITTLEQTESAYAARGVANGVLDARLARADILIRSGRLGEGERVATEALQMAEQLDKPIYMAQSRFHLARVRRAENQPDEALNGIHEAIKLYERAGDTLHSAQSFMVVAEIERQRGKFEDASKAIDQAERVGREGRSPFIEADCVYSRALLHVAMGESAPARRLFEQAKSMYMQQRREDQVRKTQSELEKLGGEL